MWNAAIMGTSGTPWGEAEKQRWRLLQERRRSHADEVVAHIERLRDSWDVVEYGVLDYAPDGRYPLLALRSRGWIRSLPTMLVTGGVHGYETSGVLGALEFARKHAETWTDRANLLVVPCVSPWGFERIQRWNPFAVDPNRSFRAGSPAPEAACLMQFIAPLRDRVLMHIDLHETTDSDESEFRPALAARDGKPFVADSVPDGFYLCADAANPQPAFQQAIIAAAAQLTHIAPADGRGEIIGSPVVAPGVIEYDYASLGLCPSLSDARFKTTTEVYPDSPRATPAQCSAAQCAAARAAVEHALAHQARPGSDSL